MLPDTYRVLYNQKGACGAMDNASDYGSEESRFESWQAQIFCLMTNINLYCLWQLFSQDLVSGPG